MTLCERASNWLLGLIWNIIFRPGYTPRAMRRNYSIVAMLLRADFLARRFVSERLALGGVPAEIIINTPSPKCVVLYLHGGGYFMGSARLSRHDAAQISARGQASVVALDYRLAPEHPHPAALDDAVAAYKELVARHGARNLIIGGDSAGGGLTLATLLRLRDEKLPLPARAFLISPWTDLAATGASMKTNADKDVWLSLRHTSTWAPWYAGARDLREPFISPLYGDYTGLPPLLIMVGDQEVLLDDATRVAEKARAAGVDVELLVSPHMQHDWLYALPWLARSKEAWHRLARFLLG